MIRITNLEQGKRGVKIAISWLQGLGEFSICVTMPPPARNDMTQTNREARGIWSRETGE